MAIPDGLVRVARDTIPVLAHDKGQRGWWVGVDDAIDVLGTWIMDNRGWPLAEEEVTEFVAPKEFFL